MTLNENMPRIVTKSPLISVATLFYSSGWFIASVVVLCYFFLTRQKRHPPPRATSNTLLILAPNSIGTPQNPQPQSILVPRDTNYRVTFGDLPKGMQRPGRRDAPAMIAVVPPESGSITISSSSEPSSFLVSTTAAPVPTPSPSEEPSAQEATVRAELEQFKGYAPETEQGSSTSPSICSVTRKPTIKFPNVFRRKSRRASEDNSRPSTPCDYTPPPSPKQRLAELLPEDEEGRERIPLSKRRSYHRAEDDSEFIRTRFVNPLKFKPRRTLSNSGSERGTPEPSSSSSASTPSSPPSSFTNHKRNRSFASIVGMAVRPHSRRTQSTSPHRGSFSSCFTSSSAASATSASSSTSVSSYSTTYRRALSFSCPSKTPSDTPRTQPYGAPHYAPLPVPGPRPHMRRASLTHSGVVTDPEGEVRRETKHERRRVDSLKSSKSKFAERMGEPEGVAVHTTAVDDEDNGLETGDVTRSASVHRRHHRVRGESGAVR